VDYVHCKRVKAVAQAPDEGKKPRFSKPPKSGYGFLAYTLDSLTSLPSVAAALAAIVDSRLGRPGYPPKAMFKAFSLKYLLGERYTVGLIERLRSSSRLREICGFVDSVPSDATFSRFFRQLASMPALSDTAMAEMVERIREHLPDVGKSVAIDSTDIRAYANPDRADTDAAWGHRTTKPKSGIKSNTELFFGYKLHSIIDSIYGVPLAHTILPANENDSPQLIKLVNKAQSAYPWLKPWHLLADRGYDSQANHRALVDRGITPIIHIRRPTAEDGLYDGWFDRRGRPVCDGETPMEYILTDPASGRHKFRCPPDGCKLKARSSGAVRYCDTTALWIDPNENLRAIGVVARSSANWKRLYSQRQTIQRMFGSMKRSRILDRYQYVQRSKVELHLGLSVLTYLATMLTRVDAGDGGRIRHMRIKVAAPTKSTGS